MKIVCNINVITDKDGKFLRQEIKLYQIPNKQQFVENGKEFQTIKVENITVEVNETDAKGLNAMIEQLGY